MLFAAADALVHVTRQTGRRNDNLAMLAADVKSVRWVYEMSARRGGKAVGRLMAGSFVLGAVVLLGLGLVELVGDGQLNPVPILIAPLVVVGFVEVIARVVPPSTRDGHGPSDREPLGS